jgi:3-dehydroquinate synthase
MTESPIVDALLVDPLTVELGDRSYPIHIGPGLLAQAGALIAPLTKGRRLFVITDDNVAPLYLEPFTRAVTASGFTVHAVTLPHGEATKSFAQLEFLMESMVSAKVERGTLVVALGGGVIGDLAGFAAAIYMRGVDFIQIPTTLLSQVDSSVGGKTAINIAHGKNLVGAFHQPRLVLADLSTLATLDQRQILAGYAEVIKYGLIDDEPFFQWLEHHGSAVVSGDLAARARAVRHSCAAKARIVSADEREAGARALLNLGHTFGHALEAETGYSDELFHGEGVALGILMAFQLSVQLGLAPPSDLDRIETHWSKVGLPTRLGRNRAWDPARLLAHMDGDKKVKDGKITFVLARGIGQSFLTRDVEAGAVLKMLEGFIGQR